MDESQARAALFVWLEKESGRNGGIFARKQQNPALAAETSKDMTKSPGLQREGDARYA